MTRPFDSLPSLFLLLLAPCAAGTFATLSGCTQAGCPAGTAADGDRCAPVSCDPEDAFFLDADGDGFGDAASASCVGGASRVSVAGDCDDASPGVHPDAVETCNGLDENCDGAADETFDCASGLTSACETSCGSAGLVACSAACEPIGECVPPAEQCNGIDDDCDGAVDEGVLSLIEAGPIGAVGDRVIGVVTALDGYVAFLRRGNQVVAQPLDASGELAGDETPMFESPPDIPDRGLDVASNETGAYVLYVTSNVARVRRYEFDTGAFGPPVELHAAPAGLYAGRIAATHDRVMALLVTVDKDGSESRMKTGTVAIDAALGSAGPFTPIDDAEIGLAVFASIIVAEIAPRPSEELPWPLTYFRQETDEMPSARMLGGVGDTGAASVTARALGETTSNAYAFAASPTGGLYAYAHEGTLNLFSFAGASLLFDPSAVVTSDSSVLAHSPTVDRAFGRWATTYDRGVPGGVEVTIALFRDDLGRTDIFPALVLPEASSRATATRSDGFALIVGSEAAAPEVLVLGCAP